MEAKARNDFSRQGLSRYKELLSQSFVLRDLEAYRKAPEFLENQRMFKAYPELVAGLATRLFTVDGSPPVHLMKMVFGQIKQSDISLMQLVRDSLKGAIDL
jgi:electron transfer flavoprotein-quinone oxidoreductase